MYLITITVCEQTERLTSKKAHTGGSSFHQYAAMSKRARGLFFTQAPALAWQTVHVSEEQFEMYFGTK